jgi:hypothetical protein
MTETLLAQVIDFVRQETEIDETLYPYQTLEKDLGVTGMDGYELMEHFFARFEVDPADYEDDEHFGPESFSLFDVAEWKRKRTDIRISHLAAVAEAKRWFSPSRGL